MTTPQARHVVSASAVLTEDEAVEFIRGRATTVRRWLRARNLVRDVPGLGRRVLWGDVVDELRLGRSPDDIEESPPRLPRAVLKPRRVG